jgi:hypothetical protein
MDLGYGSKQADTRAPEKNPIPLARRSPPPTARGSAVLVRPWEQSKTSRARTNSNLSGTHDVKAPRLSAVRHQRILQQSDFRF